MGRSRYKILDDRYPYFLTSSVIQGYPLFTNESICRILLDGINFLTNKREISIHAYVIMPNHIHLIAKGKSLGKHISSFKSYSARRIIDYLITGEDYISLNQLKAGKLSHKRDREHQLWTEEFHPKTIYSAEVMEQKIEYIHYNPVKAGLVQSMNDWTYSSYRDYNSGTPSLIHVDLFAG